MMRSALHPESKVNWDCLKTKKNWSWHPNPDQERFP